MDDKRSICLLKNIGKVDCELYEKFLENRNNKENTYLMPVTMNSTKTLAGVTIPFEENLGSLFNGPNQMSSTAYSSNRLFSNDNFQPIREYKPPEYSVENSYLQQPLTPSLKSPQTANDYSIETMNSSKTLGEITIPSEENVGSLFNGPNQTSLTFDSSSRAIRERPLKISKDSYTEHGLTEDRYCNGTPWTHVNAEEPSNKYLRIDHGLANNNFYLSTGTIDFVSNDTNAHNLPVFNNSLGPLPITEKKSETISWI